MFDMTEFAMDDSQTIPDGADAPRWVEEISQLCYENGYRPGRLRRGSGTLSTQTQEIRLKELLKTFRDIWAIGYRIGTVHGLRDRHVRSLVEFWLERGLSPATVQNRLSHLRRLCEWIGKAGMIRPTAEYVDDPARVRRATNAQYDHSWSAAGIKAKQLIDLIEDHDPYVAMQLRLCTAFMLRRKEAVMFKPYLADRGDHILVEDGTKGGRPRIVKIRSDEQRRVLEEAKKLVKHTGGYVGEPGKTLRQNLDRYTNVVRRFGITKDRLGVTPHGLRHEGLCNLFEDLADIPAPVRTDDIKRVLSTADPEKVRKARQIVAEEAGHARVSISGAYIGGLMGRGKIDSYSQEAEAQKLKRLLALRGRRNITEAERVELNELQRHLVKLIGHSAVFPDPDETTEATADNGPGAMGEGETVAPLQSGKD